MKPAAIYARVSSDRQKEEHTIASQTEALRAFALQQGFSVPDEWVFEDEGYSGATLIRPGLEKVRDLAAEGQIDAVLVHSPDRLSRKYAYQVLLMEELARNNVETLFIKAPQTATPEDQLLLQFQGMIAEYERAQILERSRRGKRHRALQGVINVLSGAPYGYRYIRKSEHASASYAIIDAEATVVRMIYELYTVRGLSIGAITRLLNEQGVATRKGISRWERSTIWAMLRNPAYKGTACFNKTKSSKRQRITRPIRLRGGIASRDSAHHERPRAEWIEIPVPPIITEETFALAAERLQGNKDHAPRRTITPSVVQGLVSCRKCGYGLYRTSTRTSARRIHYYRCLGSDAWRHLGGSVCDSKPVRQDLLDELVWREVVKLLESPQLIQEELERRLTAARNASPAKRREDTLQRELARVQKSADRLMTAYQEDLLSLDDLRRRMPELRKREQAIGGELSAIQSQLADRAGYLRLAETITSFLARLRATAKTLDVSERQRIVRLLVKEILVSNDAIVIRHAIPAPTGSPAGGRPTSPTGGGRPSVGDPSYLLRTGSHDRALRRPLLRLDHASIFEHACRQPFGNQPDDSAVANPMLDETDQPFPADLVEKGLNVAIEHPVDPPLPDPERERIQRLMLVALRSETVAEAQELRLIDRRQNCHHRRLDNLVLHGRDAKRTLSAICLWNILPERWQRSIRPCVDARMQVPEVCLKVLCVFDPRHLVDTRRCSPLQAEEARPQDVDVDVMQKRCQLVLSVPGDGFSYAGLRL
jgi:site-specific DNA recombinase